MTNPNPPNHPSTALSDPTTDVTNHSTERSRKKALHLFRSSAVYNEASIINSRIQFVPYDDLWAAEIAAMWNDSRGSWGAGDEIRTTERVQREEKNADTLRTELAILDGKVVGYCRMETYKSDDTALYVALLNVRDGYHGQKIGKALLVRAIDYTIELGFKRLDLHTWAGNTEAVPLYKKCGFFWEEGENSVHLMNFLPGLLQSDFVQHSFEGLDWYTDSTRSIAIEPDGDKQFDIHSYVYEWQHGSRLLRITMEREGKGMRALETEHMHISAMIQEPKPVAGRSYPIHLSVVNKRDTDLQATFSGQTDKNITVNWTEQCTLAPKSKLERMPTFFVQSFEEDNDWRTSPRVSINVNIDGRDAPFYIGVNAQLPLSIQALYENEECYLHTPSTMYLNVENHLNETADFQFELPSDEWISFRNGDIRTTLAAKEKTSIPLTYTLTDYGFYAEKLNVTVTSQQTPADGQHDSSQADPMSPEGTTMTKETVAKPFAFKKQLAVGFAGGGARFHGETVHHWHLFNNRYHLSLNKRNNSIDLHVQNGDAPVPMFECPRLGKPYVDELPTMRARDVQFIENGSSIGLKAVYDSKKWPGLEQSVHIRIQPHGVIRYWTDVRNTGSTATTERVWVHQPLWMHLQHLTMPYAGEIVHFGATELNYTDFDDAQLTENWLYTNNGNVSIGVTWPRDIRLYFDEWDMYTEHDCGYLTPKECVSTPAVEIAIDTYPSWQPFRDYARKQVDTFHPLPVSDPALIVQEGNPFVHDRMSVTFRTHRRKYFDGTVRFGYSLPDTEHKDDQEENGRRPNWTVQQSFTEADACQSTTVNLQLANKAPIQRIHVQRQFQKITESFEQIVFQKERTPIRTTNTTIAGHQVFTVHNGPLTIQAAPSFAPVLYSLQANEEEWLHASFPEPTQKSWWSPWSGGLFTELDGLDMHFVQKETCHASFITSTDTYQNLWQGIRLSIHVTEHEHLKGLNIDQYFLMLPGAPVLCSSEE